MDCFDIYLYFHYNEDFKETHTRQTILSQTVIYLNHQSQRREIVESSEHQQTRRQQYTQQPVALQICVV